MATAFFAAFSRVGQATAGMTAPIRRALQWLWWNSIGCDCSNLGGMSPNELLDRLTVSTAGHLWQLVCSIPGGDDCDRGGLATAVLAEILACTLAAPDAEAAAAITNFRLAQRKLAWRLVVVS